MGCFDDADQVFKKIGSCGDIMKVYLKVDNNTINDVRYEITGCAGAIAAAMAAVELVKGKTVDEALKINDGDVFKVLESIPEKKHHCIQLAVKTIHEGIQEYKNLNLAKDIFSQNYSLFMPVLCLAATWMQYIFTI